MCAIEGADFSYEFWQRTIRKARKPHRCYECGRTIAADESYGYTSAGPVDGGGWDHFHTCMHCRAAEDWLMKECRGYLHGGVLDDLEQHLPQVPMNVARLIIGMRRQWRKFTSEGLLSVPIGVDR